MVVKKILRYEMLLDRQSRSFATLYYPSKKFNADEWKINTEKRYTMHEDIIESNILTGKTKDEIAVKVTTHGE
jgi:hypothetical protein